MDMRYIVTAGGRKFWPLSPRIEDLDLGDIANALAKKCRWGGHTNTFYSVAEHCVRVAKILPPELRLWGLLHDAGEAYLPDLCRPIKQSYPQLVEAEERILDLVAVKWGLPREMPARVKWADDTLLVTEARDLMNFDARQDPRGDGLPEPLVTPISPWGPIMAKAAFVQAFRELYQEAA